MGELCRVRIRRVGRRSETRLVLPPKTGRSSGLRKAWRKTCGWAVLLERVEQKTVAAAPGTAGGAPNAIFASRSDAARWVWLNDNESRFVSVR